jgi:hypothetical protein
VTARVLSFGKRRATHAKTPPLPDEDPVVPRRGASQPLGLRASSALRIDARPPHRPDGQWGGPCWVAERDQWRL